MRISRRRLTIIAVIHLQLLLLIIVANGVPLLAHSLLQRRFSMPLDFGLRLADGERLFGTSKTVRGLLLALPVTAGVAQLLGLGWQAGLVVGMAAMAGDLLSSFIKRRLRMASGSPALGIDQVPEALLPLWALAGEMSLSGEVMLATVVAFIVIELLLSRILFRLHLRRHPY